MGVYFRMVVYVIAAMLAGQGIATLDPVTWTLVIDLKSLEVAVGGLGTVVATFIAGRVFKAKGGSS